MATDLLTTPQVVFVLRCACCLGDLLNQFQGAALLRRRRGRQFTRGRVWHIPRATAIAHNGAAILQQFGEFLLKRQLVTIGSMSRVCRAELT